MKVKQHPFCSDAAMELRQRDGTSPWSAHPCEVDSIGDVDAAAQPVFAHEVAHARRLRMALETQKGD